MNNDSQGDRPSRKSARQRVPNSFYTQVINELKRAPSKSQREPPSKTQNKKQRIYHQSSQNSQGEQQNQSENSPELQQNKSWYTCKLPKNGQILKVEFIMNNKQEPVVEKKRQEPPKNTKKADSSFDLLSLFQKAIENVNDEQEEKPVEIEPNQKLGTIKFYRPTKPTKKQDSEGEITAVRIEGDRVVFVQSVLGEVEVELRDLRESEATEEFDQGIVEQVKDKIISSQVFSQLPVFQTEE